MKKVFTVFRSLLLCAGILSSSFAFAASGESAEGYSAAEQETDPMLETRIMLAKGLNALSNFFLNDFLQIVELQNYINKNTDFVFKQL